MGHVETTVVYDLLSILSLTVRACDLLTVSVAVHSGHGASRFVSKRLECVPGVTLGKRDRRSRKRAIRAIYINQGSSVPAGVNRGNSVWYSQYK